MASLSGAGVTVDGVEEEAALRAALNDELGFYPAGTDLESVARHPPI